MPLIVAAMRKLGFDEIYDTSFTADLTVIEETNEFLGKLEKGEKMPLFTSCCPAWVKYAEEKHPELLPQVSTCKSPQQMFGSLIKAYDKEKDEKDGKGDCNRVRYALYCKESGSRQGRIHYRQQPGRGYRTDHKRSC